MLVPYHDEIVTNQDQELQLRLLTRSCRVFDRSSRKTTEDEEEVGAALKEIKTPGHRMQSLMTTTMMMMEEHDQMAHCCSNQQNRMAIDNLKQTEIDSNNYF